MSAYTFFQPEFKTKNGISTEIKDSLAVIKELIGSAEKISDIKGLHRVADLIQEAAADLKSTIPAENLSPKFGS